MLDILPIVAYWRHIRPNNHIPVQRYLGLLDELIRLQILLLLLYSLHDPLVPRELVRLHLLHFRAAVSHLKDSLLFSNWDDNRAGIFSL